MTDSQAYADLLRFVDQKIGDLQGEITTLEAVRELLNRFVDDKMTTKPAVGSDPESPEKVANEVDKQNTGLRRAA